MKKIDKLIIKSFLGPFILTTCVVVFIFLMRFIMLYFNDFIGKDLGFDVFAKLFLYFSLITIPISLPLSVLLASLMCFGNLGEHTELTAIKSAGIPISRVLAPTFIFSIIIAIFSFWYNNNINPWANLKGYSLLWDVKNTKVTLNVREGIYYNEIPGYSIKVQKKYPDGKTIKGVTVYDHTKMDGNTSVTLADSGKMYTMFNSSYLVFELFNGNNYIDFKENLGTNYNETQFVRNSFKKNKFVFSLESFGIKRTDENQFKYHEYMKNLPELNKQIDSLKKEVVSAQNNQVSTVKNMYNFHLKPPAITPINPPAKFMNDSTKVEKDSLKEIKKNSIISKIVKNVKKQKIDSVKKEEIKVVLPGDWAEKKYQVVLKKEPFRKKDVLSTSLDQAQSLKTQFNQNVSILQSKQRDQYRAEVEKWHKFTMAFACICMFLIGASLGSIIKKGGFGMPVLLAISFFILMYVLMQLGDKYAKEGIWEVLWGVWIPDLILSIIGIFFLTKATNDARLFESDVYSVYLDKIKNWRKRVDSVDSEIL
jgi:lipopolysaccharide export system permease protein